MKHRFWSFISICIVMMSAAVCGVAEPNQLPFPSEIENASITGINKIPAHATLAPYATIQQAVKADRSASPYSLKLDGKWKFNWVNTPEKRPIGFEHPAYDDSHWKTIPVPSNWQIEGYGTPNYLCAGYVFNADPPHVMGSPDPSWTTYKERNPVGSYRRWVDIPANWGNRRTVICFDGADSCLFLWINGKYVGYSTDSRTPAEFDISKYIKPGKNLIAAQVYRFSVGSYLEDQDMWFLSGIFRGVKIYSTPKVHIQDFFVKGDLDSAYRNGILQVDATLQNTTQAQCAARQLQVALYDSQGKRVGSPHIMQMPALAAGASATKSIKIAVASPKKWSAEKPYLYTTVISLTGESPEIVSCRTGFRKIEIKGRLFCINGVAVKLKGSNRHENWPDTGHVETDERRIKDLKLLKQANCNHVRTSHYCNDPRWYELCDEYGIYLVAEANLECHGNYSQSISKSPEWTQQYVARITNSVMRDRNHPSVIIWSLGNESYTGMNLDAELAQLRKLDQSRPSHYQGYPYGPGNPCDIDSQMYSSPDECSRVAKDKKFTKPFYLCEYAHAMNNSMGALGDYNDIIDNNPALMGGAIWEWQDQVLWNKRDPKNPFLAMGGGFNDQPNNGPFIIKGVVFSDRTPTPKYPEVKRVYQWIKMLPVDLTKPTIKITNRYAFLSTDEFTPVWRVKCDGKLLKSGYLPTISLKPGASKIVKLPVRIASPAAGAEYTLELGFQLKRAALWAPKGYEVASGQWILPIHNTAKPVDTMGKNKTQTSQNNRIILRSSGLKLSVDKSTGCISQIESYGQQMLKPNSSMKLWCTRAPHINDDLWAASDWQTLGLMNLTPKTTSVVTTDISKTAKQVVVQVTWSNHDSPVFSQTSSYVLYGDGTLCVDSAVVPLTSRSVIARMGMRMLLPSELNQLSYYGRGPQENYPDRMRGADLGLYSSTVAKQLTPYIASLECGNHMDTRWVLLTNKQGQGLLVQNDTKPFAFSALPYTDEQLSAERYMHDLPKSTQTALCLSAGTLGVGSAACGPGPLNQYLLWNDPICFSFVIKPINKGLSQAQQLSRQAAPKRTRPVAAWRDNKGLVNILRPDTTVSVSYRIGDGPLQKYTKPFAAASKPAITLTSSLLREHVIEQTITITDTVDRTGWRVLGCDSDQSGPESVNNILDGRIGSWWHTRWGAQIDPLPHWVAIDMGEQRTIKGVLLTGRQDMVNGRIGDYELYLSEDGKDWGTAISKGHLANSSLPQRILFEHPEQTRYIKLIALSEQAGQQFTSLAEFSVIE